MQQLVYFVLKLVELFTITYVLYIVIESIN
jgi:hypothetical protein